MQIADSNAGVLQNSWRLIAGRRFLLLNLIGYVALFAVNALHELYAPDGAQQTKYEWVTPEWARRWPVEEIWAATWRS